MTNQIVGDQQSSDTLKQLDDIEKILEEYENALIGPTHTNAEYEKYMQLSKQELDTLSEEECMHGSYSISQQIIYIQRQVNKHSARIKWCAAVTNSIAAKHWDDYDKYLKAEIRIQLICKQNDFLQKVDKIRNLAEQRLERFNNITMGMKYMSDILLEMGKTKRWSKKNG